MDRIIIIGGGVSGLALAYLLQKKKPSLDIVLLEAEKRVGGKIRTDKSEGFLCETGVNGFLDNKPGTLELAADLELSPLRSNDSAGKRYIFSGGKLRIIPESPGAFFKSNLLSPAGRLRIICELFVSKGGRKDESLAEFAKRRLGREAYEKLIDPMASGIYAGDPERLSLSSCFPRIHELEMEYGSLIRALVRLRMKAKKEGRAGIGPGPGGVLTSFYEGMEALINGLMESVSGKVRSDSRVASLDASGNMYSVGLSNGAVLEADAVVLATPAHETSGILKGFDPGLSQALSAIPYPSVSVVCLGYKKDKIPGSTKGFGFLVPFREGRKILGTLWDSSIFPNRAPGGYVLMRSMIGGARASELAMLDKERLVTAVTGELRDIMGIRAEPDFIRVYVHDKAIPQYTAGHGERLKIIYALLLKYNKLYLTGNAYRGIGVNDCIENSYGLAGRILGDI